MSTVPAVPAVPSSAPPPTQAQGWSPAPAPPGAGPPKGAGAWVPEAAGLRWVDASGSPTTLAARDGLVHDEADAAAPLPHVDPVEVDAWTVWEVEDEARPLRPLAARQDLVLAAAGADGLLAIDSATGSVRWRALPAGTPVRWALVDGDDVAVMVADGDVLLLDAATGAERWTWSNDLAGSAAAFVPGGLVVQTGGDLWAIARRSGRERWEAEGVAVAAGRRPLVVAQADVVAVGFADGSVRALDLERGGVRWRDGRRAEDDEGRVGPRALVCGDAGAVLVTGSGRRGPWLDCRDAASGERRWTRGGGRVVAGAWAGDVVVALEEVHDVPVEDVADERIVAANEAWLRSGGAGGRGPLRRRFGTSRLLGLAARDGALRWSAEVDAGTVVDVVVSGPRVALVRRTPPTVQLLRLDPAGGTALDALSLPSAEVVTATDDDVVAATGGPVPLLRGARGGTSRSPAGVRARSTSAGDVDRWWDVLGTAAWTPAGPPADPWAVAADDAAAAAILWHHAGGGSVQLATAQGLAWSAQRATRPADLALLDGTVVVVEPDAIVALSRSDGHERWSVGTGGTPRLLRRGPDAPTVIATVPGDRTVAIDVDSGSVRWQHEGTAVAVDARLVLCAGEDGFAARDAVSGAPLWRTSAPRASLRPGTVAGEVVLAWAGGLAALDVVDGRVRWVETAASQGPIAVAAAEEGEALVVGTAAGCAALRARSGRLLWSVALGASGGVLRWAAPDPLTATVAVERIGGAASVLRMRDGVELRRRPLPEGPVGPTTGGDVVVARREGLWWARWVPDPDVGSRDR